jgi:hypothetical protein
MTGHGYIVALCVACGLGFLGVACGPASSTFGLGSLTGTYVGVLIEIRQDPVGTGPIEYCDVSGVVTFDGAGNGTSDMTRRCSLDGTDVDHETLTYTVSPEGKLAIAFSSGSSGVATLALGGQLAYVSAVDDPDVRIFTRTGSFARQ